MSEYLMVTYIVRDAGNCDVDDGVAINNPAFQLRVATWLGRGYTVELTRAPE